MVDVSLVAVSAANWRACAALQVEEDQRRWVADVTYYLCLCTYGDTWHPLAIEVENEVVGFLMWGVDDDESRWIGGLVIDAAHQRHGVGRAAVTEAIRLLIAQPGCTGVALSYDATCMAPNSWHYDDPAAPTRIELCDATCKAAVGARTEVQFGCETVVQSIR